MNTFKTMIASDADYEKVYAEIYCDEKFVALVSQENGLDKLRIEFPYASIDEGMILRNIEMEGFLSALTEAKQRLSGEIP